MSIRCLFVYLYECMCERACVRVFVSRCLSCCLCKEVFRRYLSKEITHMQRNLRWMLQTYPRIAESPLVRVWAKFSPKVVGVCFWHFSKTLHQGKKKDTGVEKEKIKCRHKIIDVGKWFRFCTFLQYLHRVLKYFQKCLLYLFFFPSRW